MTEPADYRQQEELEELYAWFRETNKSFEEIFLGVKHEKHSNSTSEGTENISASTKRF